jgi:hypothetical protein
MNSRDNDQMDQWLEGALGKYGKAEPRAGLEGRILANLAAERQRLALRWRWGFALAGALAICGALAFWRGSSSHSTNKTPAIQAPVEQSKESHLAKETQGQVLGTLPIKSAAAKRHGVKKIKKIKTIELANEPRLEQFPSRRPLSEQEKMLMEFVRNSPQDAVLVAQMQAERQKELDRLIASQISKSESDQQER